MIYNYRFDLPPDAFDVLIDMVVLEICTPNGKTLKTLYLKMKDCEIIDLQREWTVLNIGVYVEVKNLNLIGKRG